MLIVPLEQPYNFSALINVDVQRAGGFGKPRHSHNISSADDNKPGAGAHLHIPHRNPEVPGRAQLGGVVAEGILGLGHADGQPVQPDALDVRQRFLGLRGEVHSVGTVNLLGQNLHLFFLDFFILSINFWLPKANWNK